MGRIPESTIEDVLARADIVQTVQEYVTLKKAGANFKGLCPFHGEKTPSFNVHPEKRIFKCFGCGEGGNVIQFLMKLEGWTFPEAVRHLAQRCGVVIEEETPQDKAAYDKKKQARDAYVDLMGKARVYFESMLWSSDGAAARHYLKERGIDDETARTFGVGFAPEGWSNLLDHLEKQQIPGSWVERAGLAIERNQKEGYYDRFRHRIIFPVIDIWGNTLAFGGRVFATGDESPKYINSSETRFYVKGQQLYGLHAAKSSIQRQGFAVVVEGNFDVISLYAMGVQMAVAPMGTALTEDQVRLLSRYTRDVVLAFDGDEAGEQASLRAIEAFARGEVEARVVRFAPGDDPDTFIRREGKEKFMEWMASARPLLAWAIERLVQPVEGAAVEKKLSALTECAEILRHVTNPVQWNHYVQEISRRLTIEPELLSEYIRRPEFARDRLHRAVTQAHRPMKLNPADMGVLVVLMDDPSRLQGFLSQDYDTLLSSVELADFLHTLNRHLQEHGELKSALLLEEIPSMAFRRTVEEAMMAQEKHYSQDKRDRFWEDCLRQLKRGWADRTLEDITRQIQQTDLARQRSHFEELVERQKQVEQFIRSLEIA